MADHRIGFGWLVAMLSIVALPAMAEDTLDLSDVPSAEASALENVLAPSGGVGLQAQAGASADGSGDGAAAGSSDSDQQQTAASGETPDERTGTAKDEAGRALRSAGPGFATGLGGPMGDVGRTSITRVISVRSSSSTSF